jgi:H+/Cl- antiporter ClcA
MIPSTLQKPDAARFWLAVLLTGISTGAAAGALTKLLEAVQGLAWGGSGTDLLDAAERVGASRHVVVLLAAGLVTGAGQIILKQLSSGNGIDTTAAIWFHAGRMPALRTLGSAVLSIFVVRMGASLGREGAPKQAGAVMANFFSDRAGFSDEQRRLLVACGAGAGMGAAYGVPLGGALFALEVMRGMLALRYVLPALFASLVATAVSWMVLPDAPTYAIPNYSSSASILVWALMAGPVAGVMSVGYVRMISWADRNKPKGWRRLLEPVVGLGMLGVVSIWFPQLLGNGKDVSQPGVHRPSDSGPAGGNAGSETGGDRDVRAHGYARRVVHSFADGGRHVGRCTGAGVVLVVARSASRTVRVTRRGGSSRGDHAGPDLDRGAADGIDRAGPFVHPAAAGGGGHGHAGSAVD